MSPAGDSCTVRFSRNDIRSVETARRALGFLADAIDGAGGHRGVPIQLALDDIDLLLARMRAEFDKHADVVALDPHSRRA